MSSIYRSDVRAIEWGIVGEQIDLERNKTDWTTSKIGFENLFNFFIDGPKGDLSAEWNTRFNTLTTEDRNRLIEEDMDLWGDPILSPLEQRKVSLGLLQDPSRLPNMISTRIPVNLLSIICDIEGRLDEVII